jgi:hypothetical protein
MPDRIFCKIVAGEMKAHTVYEDESVLAFLDIHPASRGHTVVTGMRAAEILGKAGRVTGVKLENGEVISCQLLVMAAGVRPNLEFLEGTRIQKKQGLLVGPHVNTEAGILHNFIRTRQSFTVTPDQLVAGPISWGRVLRDNRLAGASGRPAAVGAAV